MLTGACLCGSIRYSISEPLVEAEYCHCTRCQRRTGTAASVNALIAPGSLELADDEGLVRWYSPPDGWEDAFCSRCGSGLFGRDPEDPGAVWICMGTLDGDPGIRPTVRQYVAYAAGWEPIPEDSTKRFAERAG